MTTKREQIVGGVWGLLVGDALGVPYEFHQPAALPPVSEIEMTPPRGFERAHRGVPPGTWSDDGAQALALLASLLACGRLDVADFGRRLVAWYDRGELAVDGKVFDVGIQTRTAINKLRAGMAAARAGGADEHSNGNGSLMRVLPLALWHRGTDAELVADARAQSLVTHGHLRSQLCCALYCLWARRIIEGAAEPWAAALGTLRAMISDDLGSQAELEFSIRPDDDSQGTGSGYVVDCLRSARWAATGRGYEDAVKAAIALGHDTDTTACVAGGIVGLRDGLATIPERWRTALRGQELLDPLVAGLLEHLGL